MQHQQAAEPKKRGGARPNSGKKPSGIETVAIRIDKRLLTLVEILKTELKEGRLNTQSIDLLTAQITKPSHTD